jgi:hypothetical protein
MRGFFVFGIRLEVKPMLVTLQEAKEDLKLDPGSKLEDDMLRLSKLPKSSKANGSSSVQGKEKYGGDKRNAAKCGLGGDRRDRKMGPSRRKGQGSRAKGACGMGKRKPQRTLQGPAVMTGLE